MSLTHTLRGVITEAAATLDRGVVSMMERRMRGGTPRKLDDARARLLEVAARYQPAIAAPERFFPEPAPAEVTETRVGAGPEGSRVTDLRFVSHYRPFFAEYRGEHLGYAENLTAHARMYRVAGHARPTVIFLHGWGGGAYWLEERAFVVPYWLRQGFDVALFQLPFHGARIPAGKTRGAMFPSANVVRTNEAWGQAIHDLRALRAHLELSGGVVGVMGMSLGGYTAALWASLDDRLAFAVPIIPAVDMADLMWRHGEDSPDRRRAIKAGVSGELLREAFAVHAPTTRAVKLAPERLMIVAGKGDRITPPDQAERLWKHWGEPAIHWFAGGHLAQVGRAEALRAIRRRLDALALPGRPTRS